MSVSFDSLNHKFVMNLKGQLSHNLEIGSDPLGNLARINNALESMPKQLAEAKTKLENVEHQLETAKAEVNKPIPYPVENARHNYAVDNGNQQGLKLTASMGDKPVQKPSLKEKLEAYKIKAAGGDLEKTMPKKAKDKAETL